MIDSLILRWLFVLFLVINQPLMANERPKTLAYNEVTAIFKDHLNPKKTILKDLLLAIAIDHTSVGSPEEIKNIGIPYILDKGIKHWIAELNETKSLASIVNNALFLLFNKQRNPVTDETAFQLLKLAAESNYWPAKYYIAERILSKELTSAKNHVTIPTEKRQKAEMVLSYFMDCAKRNFAPCQFRVGTWMIATPGQSDNGIDMLERFIFTSQQGVYKEPMKVRRIGAAQMLLIATPTSLMSDDNYQYLTGIAR